MKITVADSDAAGVHPDQPETPYAATAERIAAAQIVVLRLDDPAVTGNPILFSEYGGYFRLAFGEDRDNADDIDPDDLDELDRFRAVLTMIGTRIVAVEYLAVTSIDGLLAAG